MKNNNREKLRLLLAKIILPFRKKKEEFLGNFRFSIAFRISFQYLKLLLIGGFLFLIGFSVLYYVAEYQSYAKKTDRVRVLLDGAEREEIYDLRVNPYYVDGITLLIADEKGEILYSDIDPDKNIILEKKVFDKIYYEKEGRNWYPSIILYNEVGIRVGNKDYTMHIQYDMTDSTSKLQWLVGMVGILYLIVVYGIIRRGKVSDLKLLEPIHDMSESANRLTIKNLDSNRLNVEGTKNELKDLAGVINSMLDRIEVSYESQKQFVSDASHELRTPIAVIEGYANLLNRWGSKDKEVLEESIEAINNEAKAMHDLIDKLLFLSRHDKKTLNLKKVRFYMNVVIDDMVKETKLVTTNREIVSEINEEVVVYGDKQALKQAVRVLIDNAVKYTKEGDKITINCENLDGDCVITVADTGIGMTRKDIERIFERFYRSDEVRNEKINGHGLGLSIAKLIILGHTGGIKVRSQFKKGTSFIVTLPKRY